MNQINSSSKGKTELDGESKSKVNCLLCKYKHINFVLQNSNKIQTGNGNAEIRKFSDTGQLACCMRQKNIKGPFPNKLGGEDQNTRLSYDLHTYAVACPFSHSHTYIFTHKTKENYNAWHPQKSFEILYIPIRIILFMKKYNKCWEVCR